MGGRQIKRHVGKQVASILNEEGPTITINVKPVQQQINGVDCGVFALAFATSILHGESPENTTYSVESLHQHLHQCLEDRRMETFPTVKSHQFQRSHSSKVVLKVFCLCRMPWYKADKDDRDLQMVECESCFNWFHRKCASIPDGVFNVKCSIPWKCLTCSF